MRFVKTKLHHQMSSGSRLGGGGAFSDEFLSIRHMAKDWKKYNTIHCLSKSNELQ
jgi:hypothetical protein